MISNCSTCANAKRTCIPPNMILICDKKGVGISSDAYNVLSIVGCGSYNYDYKGTNDLQRSFNRVRR
jgi:hypothetical protein